MAPVQSVRAQEHHLERNRNREDRENQRQKQEIVRRRKEEIVFEKVFISLKDEETGAVE